MPRSGSRSRNRLRGRPIPAGGPRNRMPPGLSASWNTRITLVWSLLARWTSWFRHAITPWCDSGRARGGSRAGEIANPRLPEQQIPEQAVDFTRVAPQRRGIVGKRIDAALRHAPPDPAPQRSRLAVVEIVTGPAPQSVADRVERGRIQGGLCEGDRGGAAQVLEQSRGHCFDRQDDVGETGGDRATRDGARARRVRLLHDHETAAVLDRLDADDAVRPRVRHQDRDRRFGPVFGEGTEERVQAPLGM